jgi:hypothetical protein
MVSSIFVTQSLCNVVFRIPGYKGPKVGKECGYTNKLPAAKLMLALLKVVQFVFFDYTQLKLYSSLFLSL